MKFDKRMRDIEKRVQDLETSVPKLDTELQEVKVQVTAIKEANKKLAEDVKKGNGESKEELTASVFSEIRERSNRRCNLVFHNVKEPGEELLDKEERIKHDKLTVKDLCSSIGVELDVLTES